MTDEDQINLSDSKSFNVQSLGAIFLASRKAKKLTQQDVSNNLRISVKQISALENNDFSALPEPMITRGFIRNYARLLEIDAEPLLVIYRAHTPDKSPTTISVQSTTQEIMSGKENSPWLMYILSSILILLFLLAWLFYIDYMPKPVKASLGKVAEDLVAVPSVEMSLPEIALPAAERQPDSAQSVLGEDTVVPNVNATSSTTAIANVSDGVVSSSEPLPKTQAQQTQAQQTQQANALESKTVETQMLGTTNQTLTTTAQVVAPTDTNVAKTKSTAIDFNTLKANASKRLSSPEITESINPINRDLNITAGSAVATKKVSMSFAEKTWVQVTDKAGKVIYEKTLQSGTTDGFDGQPPFNLVIGNAKATQLFFLGKQVDLAPSTSQNNVAHLVLQ